MGKKGNLRETENRTAVGESKIQKATLYGGGKTTLNRKQKRGPDSTASLATTTNDLQESVGRTKP